MSKSYELHKKTVLKRRKRMYKNPLIKELWTKNAIDWQNKNRIYYLFYQKMQSCNIKINKKSYDRGEYENAS